MFASGVSEFVWGVLAGGIGNSLRATQRCVRTCVVFVEPRYVFFAGAAVGGSVFNDLNGNGVRDSGEPGIGNVSVTVACTDGAPQATTVLNETVATAADGTYAVSVPLPSANATAPVTCTVTPRAGPHPHPHP